MKKIYQIGIIAAIATVIAGGAGLTFSESLMVAITAALIAPVLIFIFLRITRKSVGAFIIYDDFGIQLVFWNEEIFRKVSTYASNGRGFIIRTTGNTVFTEIEVIQSEKIKNSDFSFDTIRNENELTFIIDDLPPKSFVKFYIGVSSQEEESVLLKSGLVHCPKTITDESMKIDFWKPQKLYYKTKLPTIPVIKMFCDVKTLNFSIRSISKINHYISWFFGIAAIIGEIILAITAFALLNGNITNLDFLTWGLYPFIAGIWGVALSKDIPMFVRNKS